MVWVAGLFACCFLAVWRWVLVWVVGLVMFGVDLCRLVWFCLGLVVVAVG